MAEQELDVTQDPDFQARAAGAIDPSEALARKAPPRREIRRGDYAELPKNMVPSGSDDRRLEPVSPASFGQRISSQAGATSQLPGQACSNPPGASRTAVPAIVADPRKGSHSFTILVDNRVQGREAIPCVVVDSKRAFMRALPLDVLGVRIETGRKYLVTVTETADSSPSLRRLGAGIVRV
jgi:hypothetical protein